MLQQDQSLTFSGTRTTDPAGSMLSCGQPSHGTVTVLADGRARYVPNAGYNGPDTVTCAVRRPDGTVRSVLVAITVLPGARGGAAGCKAAWWARGALLQHAMLLLCTPWADGAHSGAHG